MYSSWLDPRQLCVGETLLRERRVLSDGEQVVGQLGKKLVGLWADVRSSSGCGEVREAGGLLHHVRRPHQAGIRPRGRCLFVVSTYTRQGEGTASRTIVEVTRVDQ